MIDPATSPLKSAVASLAERDPRSLPDSLLLVSVEEMIIERNRLDAAIATHLQVLDSRDVTVAECAQTTKYWLLNELHLGDQDATRLLSVAKTLPFRPGISEALLAGQMNLEHARAIAICVRKIEADLRDVVEKELVKLAEDYNPTELAKLARELCDKLGGNEKAEEAAQRKFDSRWVQITSTYDGMHRIDGMLDPASAGIVKAALAPLTTKAGPDDERTHAQRTADGLVSIAELAMNTGDLPEHGGEKPQVIVTIPESDLFARVEAIIGKPALLNGERITARTARMVACDAGVIPAVLGGHGEVLDLGRKTPTWSPAQRRALRIEDDGCRWPGCGKGLVECRIHHIDWYGRGGRTDTKRGIHLCRFHHHVVHHTNWQIDKGRDGKVRVWRT
jgi:hypothetical protein